MRTYFDPEMNIAMFETESVVVTDSTLTQANSFFGNTEAGSEGSGSSLTANSVDAANVLNFTN